MDARLTLRNITKRYPAVVANDGIDLTVEAGEIHAALGEKGAGQLFWNGAAVHIANPSTASPLGIAMVFPHFSLFDTLTVAENIALGLSKDTRLDELANANWIKLNIPASLGKNFDPH